MKSNYDVFAVLFVIFFFKASISQTILSGNLSCNQVLTTSGSPYRATSDITVGNGCVLTVNAGVEIQMDQNTHLIIKGKVNFMGTVSQPILIHAKDTIWGNILLDNTMAQKSLFNFVTIENAREGSDLNQEPGAIYGLNSSLEVRNCHFKNNLRCISVYGCPNTLIKDCIMDSTNRGEKVHGQYCNGSEVNGCVLYATRGDCDGIDFDASNRVLITNNSIYNGDDDAIDIGQCDSIGCDTVTVQYNFISGMINKGVSDGENCQNINIHHNVITGCAMGIGAKSNAHVIADHNTIYGCRVGVSSYEHLNQIWGPGHLTVTNCIIANSDTAWKVDPTAYLSIAWSLADDTILPGGNNMNGNPAFVNPVINPSGDFHLTAGSKAIDKGDPSFTFDSDGTRSDIGAFFFQSVGIFQPIALATSLIIYPNPSNGSFHIDFSDQSSIRSMKKIHIKILNVNALLVYMETVKPGTFIEGFDLNLNHLAKGIYYLQIKSDSEITSRKIVIE